MIYGITAHGQDLLPEGIASENGQKLLHHGAVPGMIGNDQIVFLNADGDKIQIIQLGSGINAHAPTSALPQAIWAATEVCVSSSRV